MDDRQLKLVEKTVTYVLEIEGKLILVENVPARVDEETGEQFFSPSTVERLQKIIREQQQPNRMIQTPVYSWK
jgi:YgiT-type zinc finger domain-containing protein